MIRRAPVIAFRAALAFALTMALLPHPPQLPGALFDKVQHVVAFATLAGLAAVAWPRVSYMALGAALSLFGASIEVLQLIPALHRDAELLDWIADTTAVAFVMVLADAVRLYASTGRHRP